MTLTINDTTMTSDQTPRTARLAPGCQHIWQVSWLPGEVLDRTSAITAMIPAGTASKHDPGEGHQLWPFTGNWAAEPGLTGPDAITLSSAPPERTVGREPAPHPADREAAGP